MFLNGRKRTDPCGDPAKFLPERNQRQALGDFYEPK